MSNGFQTFITRVIFSLLHSPHDRSARSGFALSPEGGERKRFTETYISMGDKLASVLNCEMAARCEILSEHTF